MLKSRSKFPPGGWRFLQPQTQWRPANGLDFSQTVHEIIKHRQANRRFNLPTDFDSVADELEAYTEKRLRAQAGCESFYVDTGGDSSKKALAPLRRQSAVAGAVGSIKRTAAGVQTLLDWLGSGAKPVSQDTADARGLICSQCPQNRKGSMYQWLQARLASEVHSLVGIAKDLNLKTVHDDKLEVCQACDCHLPLKIWVPLSHINKTTSTEVRAALDPNCWIHHES